MDIEKTICVISNDFCIIKDNRKSKLDDVIFCEECQELYCHRHIQKCNNCESFFCYRCIRKCNNCNCYYCKDCLNLCLRLYCNDLYCDDCGECSPEKIHVFKDK
jgi:hypothetical protein